MVCASDLNLGESNVKSEHKRIDIIGAGPAGMELAIQSASRGIPTQIFEKEGFLGGKLIGAALIYKPYRSLLEYYRSKMQDKLIKIYFNKEISSNISTNQDQQLIDASGSINKNDHDGVINIQDWLYPFIQKANGEVGLIENAICSEDILNVSILGADTIQLHAAKFLDQLGMNVTLIKLSSDEEIGKSMPVVLRWKVIDEIKNNVQIIDIEEFNQADYDLNLSAEFASKNSNGSLKIGDASRGCLLYTSPSPRD